MARGPSNFLNTGGTEVWFLLDVAEFYVPIKYDIVSDNFNLLLEVISFYFLKEELTDNSLISAAMQVFFLLSDAEFDVDFKK